MKYLPMKHIVYASALHAVSAIDYMKLDPCKLLCHMEHTIDQCKLVTSTAAACKNLYWKSGSKQNTHIERVHDDSLIPVSFADSMSILRVGKGGCEKACESHDECFDRGSECKLSGVCLNLFWNRGTPIRSQMSSCYDLSGEACDDATPILCGGEQPLALSDQRGSQPTNRTNDSSGSSSLGEPQGSDYTDDSSSGSSADSSSSTGSSSGSNGTASPQSDEDRTMRAQKTPSDAAGVFVAPTIMMLVVPLFTRL